MVFLLDYGTFFAFHLIFEILDWVAQPSPKFKSQLNCKCKLNSCTFQIPGKFKCQLSLNWNLILIEGYATQYWSFNKKKYPENWYSDIIALKQGLMSYLLFLQNMFKYLYDIV